MMNESLKTIATFNFAHEMGLVRSKLESEGIECFVKDELVSQTYVYNAVGGIKLQVRASDAERAQKIVNRMEIFQRPSGGTSRLESFDRLTACLPLIGSLSFVVRFFILLVVIAVVLSLVYVLMVL